MTAEATLEPGVCGPRTFAKALAGARLALERAGADGGVRLQFDSPIPRSKGLGSSTADVAGAIAATALAHGLQLGPAEVTRLALRVEPTDGSAYPGLVVFDHRAGQAYEPLGPAPALGVVALDFGGAVDTVAFNAVDRAALLRDLEPLAEEALALVRRGLAEGRLDLIGRGATASALANEAILPKPRLAEVLAFGRERGALGLCVGHSGTVIGVLLEPTRDPAALAREARRELAGLDLALPLRLIGGGVRVVRPVRVARAERRAGATGHIVAQPAVSNGVVIRAPTTQSSEGVM